MRLAKLAMAVFGKRLKDARLAAGLSQEALGIKAGLEEASASARMNRYELGRRTPDPVLVQKFGKALNVPAAYFYAVGEDEARLLMAFHRLSAKERAKAVVVIEGMAS